MIKHSKFTFEEFIKIEMYLIHISPDIQHSTNTLAVHQVDIEIILIKVSNSWILECIEHRYRRKKCFTN